MRFSRNSRSKDHLRPLESRRFLVSRAPLSPDSIDLFRSLSMDTAAFLICRFLTVSSCRLRTWMLFLSPKTFSILSATCLLGVVDRTYSSKLPLAPRPASRRTASLRDSFFPLNRYKALYASSDIDKVLRAIVREHPAPENDCVRLSFQGIK